MQNANTPRTAAQRVVLRDTGTSTSHADAIATIKHKLDTIRAAAGLPCRRNADTPRHHIDPAPINWRSIIDPLYSEDREPTQREIDAGLTRVTRWMAAAWPAAWRAALAATAATLISASCTDHAHADTIGIHVASWHDRQGYNNVNPGVVYRRAGNGLTVGAYCNSESRSRLYPDAPRCRLSTYVGRHWDWQVTSGLTIGATAGALTGYGRAKAIPFAVPSVRIGDHVRILYAPAADPKGASVVSLVIEAEI